MYCGVCFACCVTGVCGGFRVCVCELFCACVFDWLLHRSCLCCGFRWCFLCVWLVFCGFGSEGGIVVFGDGGCCRVFWVVMVRVWDCWWLWFGGLTRSAQRDFVRVGWWTGWFWICVVFGEFWVWLVARCGYVASVPVPVVSVVRISCDFEFVVGLV